ncbi:hypothetical protein FRC07_002118 [Ceratobasidium sp. 392]|nr:hypothetical protein FRC07_002118 [Ceratobasidium sp. 392]
MGPPSPPVLRRPPNFTQATIYEVPENYPQTRTSTPRNHHPISPRPSPEVVPPVPQRSIAPSKRAASSQRTTAPKPYPTSKPVGGKQSSVSSTSDATSRLGLVPKVITVPGANLPITVLEPAMDIQPANVPKRTDPRPSTQIVEALKIATASAPRPTIVPRPPAPAPVAKPKTTATQQSSTAPSRTVLPSLVADHAEDRKPLRSPIPSESRETSPDISLDYLDDLAARLFGHDIDEDEDESGEEITDAGEEREPEEQDEGSEGEERQHEDEEVNDEIKEEEGVEEEEEEPWFKGISSESLMLLRRYLARHPQAQLRKLCKMLLKRQVSVSPFQVFRALRQNKVEIRTDPDMREDTPYREDYAFRVGEFDFKSLVFVAQFDLNVQYRWAITGRKRQGWPRTQYELDAAIINLEAVTFFLLVNLHRLPVDPRGTSGSDWANSPRFNSVGRMKRERRKELAEATPAKKVRVRPLSMFLNNTEPAKSTGQPGTDTQSTSEEPVSRGSSA